MVRLFRIDGIPPRPLIVVVLTSDFVDFVRRNIPSHTVINAFLNEMRAFTQTNADRHDLRERLKTVHDADPISVLFQYGLVVNRTESMLSFSIPECGRFIHHLIQGRLELVAVIKRRKQSRNRTVQALEKTALKKSMLSSLFILQDLIALGVLERRSVSNDHGTTIAVVQIADESLL
uniref:Uncharacterized protein n=1 Tax=Spongospora subterranea TaxID=70186 RepID=A0A0H5RCM7_9EUKA|eukprot:CRZ11773.1 hypothetical protein [Spongospora subterranea]